MQESFRIGDRVKESEKTETQEIKIAEKEEKSPQNYPIIPYERNLILSSMKERISAVWEKQNEEENLVNVERSQGEQMKAVQNGKDKVHPRVNGNPARKNSESEDSRAPSGLSMILDNYGDESDEEF